jgi:hypothetical protein
VIYSELLSVGTLEGTYQFPEILLSLAVPPVDCTFTLLTVYEVEYLHLCVCVGVYWTHTKKTTATSNSLYFSNYLD